jgi:hypothetical protein
MYPITSIYKIDQDPPIPIIFYNLLNFSGSRKLYSPTQSLSNIRPFIQGKTLNFTTSLQTKL